MALGNWKGLFRGRQPPDDHPPSSPPEIGDPWDGRSRLLALGDAGDWLTLSDCYTGISALGGTGSGKTSTLAVIALLLMAKGCGFVWMCAKTDELANVRRWARRAKRGDDVYVIGEDENGEISPWRFNPLDYEATAAGTSTAAVVQYLTLCQEVLSRGNRRQSGDGGDSGQFFRTQFERLLSYCIDTGKLAGLPLTLDLLRKIQLSAPTREAFLTDETWQDKSVCWQCMVTAAERAQRGEVPLYDVERLDNFWTKDYLTLAEKTRSTVDVMFAALADVFIAGEPVRSILTSNTTVTPDDVMQGAIVVLNLPTRKYHEAGRLAQFCFKYSFQRAMLRRVKTGDPLRPTVLWVDEAHNFCHATDSEYFAEVRANRGINVWLEQGVNGYKVALGANSNDDVDHFLENLQTKFFFQSGSPETNRFAAEVLGKRRQVRESQSWNQSEDGSKAGGSSSHEVEYQVLPGEFSELMTGGPENNQIVEAYIYKRGVRFAATGANYLRGFFPQTDLTKPSRKRS